MRLPGFAALLLCAGSLIAGPDSYIAKAGAEFTDDRFAHAFVIPRVSRVRIRPRGNFHAVEIRSVRDADYFLYYTTFALERPAADLSGLFGACEEPIGPGAGDYDVRTSCEFRSGYNDLIREIRLIRSGDRLHLLQLTYRREAADAARRIQASLTRS